jgi:quinol monooxygenase YgiN
MSNVLFSIQYDIVPEKRDEYLKVVKELKNLLKAEGLESYVVYEVKGKAISFQELYTFVNMEAYEAFDDMNDERINILVDKISGMSVDKSTKYNTLVQLSDE